MTIQRVLVLTSWPAVAAALTGCALQGPLDTSRLSPLEVRAMETRAYDHRDTKTALKTVLNVLQDEAFLVDYGNEELGFLHAKKIIGSTTEQDFIGSVGTFSGLAHNPMPWYGNIVTIEATAQVSDFGNQTRVRVNFQQTLLDWSGRIIAAGPVSNPKSYQEFFAKLDRGFFIQKEGL